LKRTEAIAIVMAISNGRLLLMAQLIAQHISFTVERKDEGITMKNMLLKRTKVMVTANDR